MGVTLSKQHMDKMKCERVDLEQLHSMVKKIKTNEDIEEAIKIYLNMMTLREKIGQLFQISCGDENIPQDIIQTIIDGRVGSFLNVWKMENTNQMQKIAMEQSRLKIPLLIGRDVIHGYRTIFPIPLAQAASFDVAAVERGNRIAAIECSAMGQKWTFSPMVDIARDPRWGRIA
jgi:beta-glucosidase